jgi:hypothetical protein
LRERERERERERKEKKYLGTFFLYPEDIKSLILGTIWNFSKGTRLP